MPGEFTAGEAVADGYRRAPDEAGPCRVEQRALADESTEGIRPVGDHEPYARTSRRDHQVEHGPHVGVEPGPDVLQVVHEGVDAAVDQQFVEALATAPVGVVDRQAGGGVRLSGLALTGLFGPVQPVFGTEQGDQPRAGLEQRGRGRAQVGEDAGVVGHQPEPSGPGKSGRRVQPCDPGRHRDAAGRAHPLARLPVRSRSSGRKCTCMSRNVATIYHQFAPRTAAGISCGGRGGATVRGAPERP
ncbi:hypothetical protein OK006_1983 [Actinobacteria bacterium OK006]|nr:hypothetical protein OK006_1983 [Actinobacteria bacterium OK006]